MGSDMPLGKKMRAVQSSCTSLEEEPPEKTNMLPIYLLIGALFPYETMIG